MHSLDLFAIRRRGGDFGEPVLLTAGSNQPFNDVPVLSRDGNTVIARTKVAEQLKIMAGRGAAEDGFKRLLSLAMERRTGLR